MKTKKESRSSSMADSSSRRDTNSKESKSETLTKLYAQKAMAKDRNDKRTMDLIQKVIDLLEKRKGQ